jgi:hypothetical protein
MGENNYGVWCEVWGGVTGSRASWLKQNGQTAKFTTLEAAEKQAAEHQRTTMGSPYRTAIFSYSARPLPTENPT